MKLEYTLTLRDFKEALKLHRHQRFARSVVPWIGPILLLVSLTCFIVFSVKKDLEFSAQALAVLAGALVVTIGTPIARFISLRKSYNRLFPANREDRRSFLEIDDEGILRKLSGVSELKVHWSGVFDFVQNEKITMLYTNRDCFLLFPTQVMSSTQRAELNELIGRHLVKR